MQLIELRKKEITTKLKCLNSDQQFCMFRLLKNMKHV